MIKLTLTSSNGDVSKVFDKEELHIGSDEGTSDFMVPWKKSAPFFLKIFVKEGVWYVENVFNDPFLSLNGLPFRKKEIKSGNQLQMGSYGLLFEKVDRPVRKAVIVSEPTKEAPIEPQKEKKREFLVWSKLRRAVWTLFIALIVVASITLGLYLRASGKSSQEEKQIAGALADIAMALRHARLEQITPQHSNITNPEFLKTHISKVLSPKLNTLTEIDAQGRFIKHPYILRIYSTANLSRFLIIAQPAPNLFHWVMMKGAIVIDSNTMELRKIGDVKLLNRFLAHQDPLEGISGEEISYLLSQGQIMSLPSLAGEKNNWGFTPPSAIGFVRPKAENYIYNAPRYHPFGEAILLRALKIQAAHAISEEVAQFRHDVKALSEFPDLILYSSEGMKTARRGQKALNSIVPEHEFLVGSLKFNQAGIIAACQILMDESRKEIASSYDILPLDEVDEILKQDINHFEGAKTDKNNPVYIRLHDLKIGRKKALVPHVEKIAALLAKHATHAQSDFDKKLDDHLVELSKTDREQEKRVREEIGKLIKSTPEMPMEQMMKFIQATGLEALAQGEERLQAKEPQMDRELFHESLQEVIEASSIEELEEKTRLLAMSLNLENVQDAQELILYQNKLHEAAIKRIASLVLDPESKISAKERPLLEATFKHIRSNEGEEREYFLAEFDRGL